MENILIVEKDQEVIDYLSLELSKLGFNFFIASSVTKMKELYNDVKENYLAVLTINSSEVINYLESYQASLIILTDSIESDNYRSLNRRDIVDFVLKTRNEELDYAVKLLDNMRYYSTLNALSVDDSATARMIVSRQLKLLKFNVFEAEDGIEALKVLENENIDLVITDYNMPNMDGLDLTINIRKKYSKEEIVVVALTAVDTPENTAAFLKYGATGFIAKPLSKEAFNYTVNNSLELNRTVRENLEYTKTINENLLFIKLDDDFSIVDVSDAFIKQSGHKKSNLLGEDYSILYDDKDLYTDMILNLLEDNSFNDTLISEKADGSQCHYKISVVCVKDKKGIVEGLLDIREDITDKIILEQQQETLFEQSKFNAMGSLLKDIAHQWRQPLNVISLQMEGLQITAETGDLDSEFIDMVYTQSQEQISYLTDIISSFSSYFSENGKDEEIDILRLLESTSKILAMYLEEKNIKIDISGKTFMTRGNKDKLSQVILNLINNSIESIEKKQEEDKQYQGTIIIRSFAELKKIEIVDNGIGVDEKIRDKIFDPYFTTKFKDRGVGLSLYLSKVIIEQNLGGKLGCLKFDDGASFYINF